MVNYKEILRPLEEAVTNEAIEAILFPERFANASPEA